MQKFWIGKNVDLGLLTEQICDFFNRNYFKTMKEEMSTGYRIFAMHSLHFRISEHICVTIEGDPNNFSVKFEKLTKKRKRNISPLMFIEQMLFGGYMILKDLKSDEAWLRLEKEFWRFVENSVLQLTNTAYPNSY
jgi:hypothetical protein